MPDSRSLTNSNIQDNCNIQPKLNCNEDHFCFPIKQPLPHRKVSQALEWFQGPVLNWHELSRSYPSSCPVPLPQLHGKQNRRTSTPACVLQQWLSMNQVAYQHRNKVYQPETVSPESVFLYQGMHNISGKHWLLFYNHSSVRKQKRYFYINPS